jgi:hypothetical protein
LTVRKQAADVQGNQKARRLFDAETSTRPPEPLMHPQHDQTADHAFFNVLGIIFAAMITLAATMSFILPPGEAGRTDADMTDIASRH